MALPFFAYGPYFEVRYCVEVLKLDNQRTEFVLGLIDAENYPQIVRRDFLDLIANPSLASDPCLNTNFAPQINCQIAACQDWGK